MLQDVLGLLARAEHVPAEREQPAVVGVVERLERGVVPAADAGDELRLRRPPGGRRRPNRGRRTAGVDPVGVGDVRHCGHGFPWTASLTQGSTQRARGSERRQAELELAQEVGEPALLVGGERAEQVALVVEVRLGDGVDEAVAGLR